MMNSLNYDELQEVCGGFAITITVLGVTLTGAKAVAAIVGAGAVLTGVGGLGLYLGYK